MRLKINAARTQKDINRIQRKLTKLGQDIKDDSHNKIQEVTPLGFNYAKNLAPHYHGHLKKAMRFEVGDTQGLIISSPAPEDFGFPVNVAFDEGKFGNMTMGFGAKRRPFEPRGPGVGFMKQTAMFLQQEFGNRMKMAISHSIQKFGKKR